MASHLVSLKTIRDAVRQRTDRIDDTFVDDTTELNPWINLASAELYDLLVNTFSDYFITLLPQAVVSGIDLYPLPADFLKLTGVDYLYGSNQWLSVESINKADRNKFTSAYQIARVPGVVPYRYYLEGQNLVLTPLPTGGSTIRLRYVPCFTPMAGDTDTIDEVDGYSAFVIAKVCAAVAAKDQADTRYFEREADAQLLRLKAAAVTRDASEEWGMHTERRGRGWR